MTYVDYIRMLISDCEIGEPIFISDIAERLADEFAIEKKKAAAATSVVLQRLLKNDTIPNLCFYSKGIYYKALKTPFGQSNINKGKIIHKKYLEGNSGYFTDYKALYDMGLTTQMPAKTVIASNKARDCIRYDKALGVYIRLGKTDINENNKDYLQILDILTILKNAPAENGNPYVRLGEIIEEKGLDYRRLLAFADRYYSRSVLLELAHVAESAEE